MSSQEMFDDADIDMNKISSALSTWMLCHSQPNIKSGGQPATPFKKVDVFKDIKHLINKANVRGRQLTDLKETLFDEACKKCLLLFGVEVTVGDDGYVYLINKLRCDPQNDDESSTSKDGSAVDTKSPSSVDESVSIERGVLFIILSVIFMSGGMMRESQLIKFLKQIGISYEGGNEVGKSSRLSLASKLNKTSTNYQPVANVKELLFKIWSEKQHYLHVTKVSENDENGTEDLHEFRWGKRAELEVKKAHVLTIVSQMYGLKGESFKEQLLIVREEEESEREREKEEKEHEDGEETSASQQQSDSTMNDEPTVGRRRIKQIN